MQTGIKIIAFNLNADRFNDIEFHLYENVSNTFFLFARVLINLIFNKYLINCITRSVFQPYHCISKYLAHDLEWRSLLKNHDVAMDIGERHSAISSSFYVARETTRRRRRRRSEGTVRGRLAKCFRSC